MSGRGLQGAEPVQQAGEDRRVAGPTGWNWPGGGCGASVFASVATVAAPPQLRGCVREITGQRGHVPR
ncbi:hypothetical protein [Actinopolyspora xinjiangensis]|uniref:hypothetical protein n=1 Tax=Actinopolyspora xinjiangensis TaxID=405564 RepID=UPI0011143D31|nr:hypothetical protein [Actinopolyspora xinjiangensis]